MKVKRYIAAIAALLVLAAPAALAATAVTSSAGDGGTKAPEAKSAAVAKQHRLRHVAASRNVRLAGLVARLHGRRLAHNYARKAQVKPLEILQRSNVRLRRELRALRLERAHYRAAFRRVPRSTLSAIANCESHGNPRAIGGGGRYRGMFQMTFQIWSAVGGHGDPAAASVGEQYYRAALVYSRYGRGQWPVCGR
jgi:hypothetical protein